FTRRFVELRREEPVPRRRRFFSGRRVQMGGQRDIVWKNPAGLEMSAGDWHHNRALQILLGGDAIPSFDPRGERITGRTLLILMNGSPDPVDFILPVMEGGSWDVVVDTRSADAPDRTLPAAAAPR